MFKVFGVTDVDGKKTSTEHHGGHVDTHETEAHSIDIEIREGRDHETDIGQIALDVLDCPDALVIVAPIAGVDPSDVDIALSRNILTISGERKQAPIYLDTKRILVEECFYGAFSRSVILPENLAFDKIKATIEYNVVIISIPKLTLLSKTIKIGE